MRPIDETIIMWGPTGSGKTSLFYAFLKKLQKLSVSSKQFYYEALDLQSGFPVDNNIGKSGIEATLDDIVDDIISIKRIPKIRNQENELSCAFVHKVHLQDYAGQYSIAATGDYEKVLNSENLILALDPYKKFDYRLNLANLHQRLLREQSDKARIRIAACVTKIDLDQNSVPVDYNNGRPIMDNSSLDDYITRRFGNDVKTELGMLAADNRFFVKIFLTSAVGFYFNEQENKRMSNYLITDQPDTPEKVEGPQKWLKDETKWNPVGVEDPFFWIFTLSERKILDNTRSTFEALWNKQKVNNYKEWSGN